MKRAEYILVQLAADRWLLSVRWPDDSETRTEYRSEIEARRHALAAIKRNGGDDFNQEAECVVHLDDDTSIRVYLGGSDWHDGPGYYWVCREYLDEGSCGAYASLDDAIASARRALLEQLQSELDAERAVHHSTILARDHAIDRANRLREDRDHYRDRALAAEGELEDAYALGDDNAS